jgi:alpha-1,6-mannosyltransferase
VSGAVTDLTAPAAARPDSRRILRALATFAGGLSLVGIVGGSVLVVLAAAERRSFLSPTSHAGFPHWMSGPLAGLLPGLSHHVHTLEVQFSIVLAAMYALYVVAVLCSRAVPAWAVVATLVAVHVVFLLSPPLSFTDIFNYVNYARMDVVHGLNPYVHVPVAASHDPAYKYTTWHHLKSPYGPLFTLGTYSLTPLGIPVAYWVFKASVAAASLGVLALVWKCARLLGRSPRAAVAFAGLNPLYLVYGLGGQHNDAFMMLLVMTGVYLLLRDRERVGGSAFAAAVAVKASAGILLPVVLAGARRRGRVAIGMAGALTLIAFGGHLPNDRSQSKLVVPFGLTNQLGLALGIGGVTSGLRLGLELALAAGVIATCAVLLVRRRRGYEPQQWLIAAGAVSLLLLLTLTWVMPWYVFWVIPIAAILHRPGLRIAVLVVGVTLLITWLPLSQQFFHDVLHVYPTRTAVGKQNSAYVHRLLR